MTKKTIGEKLVDYLHIADERKIKAFYTMIEDEINTYENDWDERFVEELKKRSNSFKNGSAKTYSWEETKKAAIERVQFMSK